MKKRNKIIVFIIGVMLVAALLIMTTVPRILREAKGYEIETPNIEQRIDQKDNYQIVFWKEGCPFCKGALPSVGKKAESSKYPTYYIDCETEEGEKLVEQYGVEYAATIVSVRGENFKTLTYVKKTNQGEYVSDKENVNISFAEKW